MMEVISTRRYEARPPPSATHPALLIDPENSVALVKEEEWETRKKKEITTTRQIETRVKRQVVLEDGEVVVDSGPLVTTNTTEDVEQQEHTTQERRTTGDQPQEVEWPPNGMMVPADGGPVRPGSVVQKELNETVVRSREEIEERLETEDRQQLGDISDEVRTPTPQIPPARRAAHATPRRHFPFFETRIFGSGQGYLRRGHEKKTGGQEEKVSSGYATDRVRLTVIA